MLPPERQADVPDRMSSTPVSLLERLRQPNQAAAWDRFVHLYTPLLCHWSHRLGLRGQDIEDLVQEILTVLVQRLPEFQYDPDKRFRGWLWTVTLNKWRERFRRIPTKTEGTGPHVLDELPDPNSAEGISEVEYRQYLTRRAMELMCSEFKPATWKAFWECVVNERPAAEVARELELSENAVYLAKGRVLRLLRKELEGLLD